MVEFIPPRMDNGQETPRKQYLEEPRKALWNHWYRIGREIWKDMKVKEMKHPMYPREYYARWYAEFMRDKFLAWKDYRTQSLADDVKEGAD